MKKIIFSTILLVTLFANAQQFEVLPNGLRDKANTENSFVVITTEGKAAKELYDKALGYINETYKNPELVIKGKTEGEYLKFETYAPKLFIVNNSGAKIPIDVKYTTELRFKDGKVKYEIIELDMGKTVFSGSIWTSYPIYNAKKENELRLPETKEFIEQYFNSQVNKIQSFISGKNAKNDW